MYFNFSPTPTAILYDLRYSATTLRTTIQPDMIQLIPSVSDLRMNTTIWHDSTFEVSISEVCTLQFCSAKVDTTKICTP